MEYYGNNFSLTQLNVNEALELNRMMLANKTRFEDYLPVTLSQNLSPEESRVYIIEKQLDWSNGKNYTLALKGVGNKSIAGLIILKNLDIEKSQGEFAYCICKSFKAKGWATEAVAGFIDLAAKSLHIHNFQIITHRDNYASVKVATTNGFHWVETLENSHSTADGQPVDMELYELKTTA